MALATFENNYWTASNIVPSDKLEIHPGAHVLQYSSTCFEGLKAFKHEDGSVNIFRMDANIQRKSQRSDLLSLPEINTDQLVQMVKDIIGLYANDIPSPPSSMYIRPTQIGTEAAIGKAAAPSKSVLLYVLLSPVGDYLTGGAKPSRPLLEEGMHCAPHMGMIKSGGNYASALRPIIRARKEHISSWVQLLPFTKVKRQDQNSAISYIDVTERLKTHQPQPIPH